jgi:hypothetical protein
VQYIMPIVEQLDRAATELATDHPINNRLALILVDNAVELIVHRHAVDEVREDLHRPPPHAKYPHKLRVEARGRYIGPKLQLARRSGVLNEIEDRFIDVCHQYRNQLYHVGIGHTGVIRALAGEYYRFACDLFGHVAPSGVTHASDDRYTEVGQRYVDTLKAAGTHYPDAKAFAELLKQNLPDTPALPETLWNDAETRIDEIAADFDFLVKDNPAGNDAAEVLRTVQFSAEFERRLVGAGIEGPLYNPDQETRVRNVRKEMEANWKPRHSSVPLEKWRARAEKVSAMHDPMVALHEYEQLRSDMAPLETTILDAAAGLDSHIQSQIDWARGK